MIKYRTVLILGAGASNPFGLPLARDLRTYIVDNIHIPDQSGLAKLLLEYGFPENLIQKFRKDFFYSQKYSIDAFLENRPEFTEIGKTTIAAFLLPHENKGKLFADGDWYQYLFNHMNGSFDEFIKNPLAIVTYNYDRSLECFLFIALKNSHGKTDDECANIIRSIPIVHLHGKLGELVELDPTGLPYGETRTEDVVKKAAQGIKIVHERQESEQYNRAHELIAAASRVCFLGFGYDRLNLQRLLAKDVWRQKGVICGTAWDSTEAERGLIENYFPQQVHLGSPAWGNLRLLRERAFFEA